MALLIFKPHNLATYLHFGQRDYDALGILNANYSTEAAAKELMEKGDLVILKEKLEDCPTFENDFSLLKEECRAIDLNQHEISSKVEKFTFENGAWTLNN